MTNNWIAVQTTTESINILLSMSDEPTYISLCQACKMRAACDLKYRGVCLRLNKTL